MTLQPKDGLLLRLAPLGGEGGEGGEGGSSGAVGPSAASEAAEFPDDYICPITAETMTDPLRAQDHLLHFLLSSDLWVQSGRGATLWNCRAACMSALSAGKAALG